MEQIGGKQDDGAPGTYHIDGLRFVYFGPIAVGESAAAVGVGHQASGGVALRQKFETSIGAIRLFKVDSAAYDAIGLRSEVGVVLVPAG